MYAINNDTWSVIDPLRLEVDHFVSVANPLDDSIFNVGGTSTYAQQYEPCLAGRTGPQCQTLGPNPKCAWG